MPDGSTGLRVVRPQFRLLLDLLTQGAVDGLIAYDLDRVARDPRDLEDLIDVVETARVPVESVTGSLRLANDSDVTMARVMVAVANKSSRDSSRRIARKHEELAERGQYAGGVRRFGYERDGMTLVPREAEAIRWAAARVLEGASVSSLARDLDAKGVHPVKAAQWSPRALTDILRSPRIAGLRVHRGEVVGKAAWPAIVDQETHEALVATLHDRGRGRVQPALVRWCNQLLYCALCERPLWGAYVGSKGRAPYRYWCNSTRGGCGRITITGPAVEAEVERQVLDYLQRPDVLASLANATSADHAARARAEVAEDDAQLKQLSGMWARKQITLAEYAEARKIIEQRIEGARAVMLSTVPERVRRVFAAEDVTAAWSGLDPATKREVVKALVKGWRVHPADKSKPPKFDPERLEVIKMTRDNAED
jgi:site-specific DNA recombinase